MKKSLFFAALIVVLVASLFATTALAARTTTNNLIVFNKTEGTISIGFENAGNPIWKTAYGSAPFTTFALPPVIYSYRAITICGTGTGTVNMSQTRVLRFQCVNGRLQISAGR